jgi:putative ABC transport system permease protein
MSFWTRLHSWTSATVRSSRMERDMDDEMRFHVEAHVAELMRGGVPKDQALRQARLEFGSVETAKSECRDAVGVSFLETLLQDLRHCIRAMLRTPVFGLTAVIVLALGIGATTAIFSVVDAVLLQPLAYRNSDRLVTILMNGDGPAIQFQNQS